MNGRRLLIALLVVSWPFASAFAQPKWAELSPQEQAQFERYAEQWDQMSDERRARIVENHKRWQNMSPEQRKAARKKFAELKKLSPEQRKALRECYRRQADGEEVNCPKPGAHQPKKQR